MVWETSAEGKTWTFQPEGRGVRSVDVKKGVYVIDHKPTGKFIIGSSDDVTREVDKQIHLLHVGKHGIKKLQDQYTRQMNADGRPEAFLSITEFPIKSDKEIQRAIKEIRESNDTEYCLLGELKHNAYLTSGKAKPLATLVRKQHT